MAMCSNLRGAGKNYRVTIMSCERGQMNALFLFVSMKHDLPICVALPARRSRLNFDRLR